MYWENWEQHLKKHGTIVVVTLVAVEGSAPQEVGAKMLVSSSGEWLLGSVGGGKVEATALLKAKEIIEFGEPNQAVYWNLQKDLGMSCGGAVRLFFEVVKESLDWEIVVFGAGHISQSLIPILLGMNAKVYCVDPRKEWLDKIEEHSHLEKMSFPKYEDFNLLDLNAPYVLSLTKGHTFDLPVIDGALKASNYLFLGAIGSDIKAKKIKIELGKLGHSSEAIENLRCPVGLDIGDNTPGQIAVSIAAELLTVKSELDGNAKNNRKD